MLNKRVIILCNTYFQLIVALKMKLTLWKQSEVSIIVTDHTKQMIQAISGLKESGLFENVIYWETNKIDKKEPSNFNKLRLFLECTHKRNRCKNLLGNKVFDEFVFYNNAFSSYLLFSYLYGKNHNIVVSRMEEGVTSYNDKFEEGLGGGRRLFDFIKKYRTIFNRKDLYAKVQWFYCFVPKLYEGSIKTVQIPSITNSDNVLKDVLRNIFNINKDTLSYPCKYIYFASIGDLEGGEKVGEVDLVRMLVEKVGKENLMVKLHPRDYSGQFEKLGVVIDKNKSIPWEAIQLNYDFSGYTFISTISSSVLSLNVVYDSGAKICMLHRLSNYRNNIHGKRNAEEIEKIAQNVDVKNLFLINNMDEILNN